jgi:hypothetical protein
MKIRVKTTWSENDVEFNTLLTETRVAGRSGNASMTDSTQVRGLTRLHPCSLRDDHLVQRQTGNCVLLPGIFASTSFRR